MSSRLEKFIKENRESFDSENPAPEIWNRVEGMMDNKTVRAAVPIRRLYMAAAAAVLVLVISGALIVFLRGSDSSSKLATTSTTSKVIPTDSLIAEINPNYAREVYHFTQLIEIKQSELEKIRKDEPELYKKFLADITRLDSSYNTLQNQLPQNPNREQLLEAMIQNLRLQTELLNQQLQIIQQIKKTKKPSNDTNSSI